MGGDDVRDIGAEGHFPGETADLFPARFRIVCMGAEVFMDVSAVAVCIEIGSADEIFHEEVCQLFHGSSLRISRERPVQIILLTGVVFCTALPEAVLVDRMNNDDLSGDVLRPEQGSQLQGCGDARIFSSVNAGGNQEDGPWPGTCNFRDRKSGRTVRNFCGILSFAAFSFCHTSSLACLKSAAWILCEFYDVIKIR